MNAKKRINSPVAIVLCVVVISHMLFHTVRTFAFPDNTEVYVMFEDNNGYHIEDVTANVEDDGRLTLPDPKELGAVIDDNVSYVGWKPVVFGNSLANVRKVIENGGNIVFEDFDESNPPIFAPPSVEHPPVATPSVATPSVATESDIDIINDLINEYPLLTDEESSNTTITFYRKNSYVYRLGYSIALVNRNNSSILSNDINNIVSKNGYKKQILFVAITENLPDNVPDSGSTDSGGGSSEAGQNAPNAPNAGNQGDNNAANEDGESGRDGSNMYVPKGFGDSDSSGNDAAKPKRRVSINSNITKNGSPGFSNSKTASVTVTDGNFEPNNYKLIAYKIVDGQEILVNADYSWSSNGDKNIATFFFDDDGEYRIVVAENENVPRGTGKTNSLRFEEAVKIDTTAPIITITGVDNLTANSKTITPIIRYSDSNIDLINSSITLTSVTNGQTRELLYNAKKSGDGYLLNINPIYIDDNYILRVKIYDLAGNLTEKQVNFSVNRKGATFVFKPEELVGKYANKPFYPVIEVWNTDEISIVSATINGMDEEYEFIDGELRFINSIDKDGKYIFNLEVVDTAGNRSAMKPVELIYDATKPVNIISGVEDGGSYEGTLKVILSTELPGDFIDSVWLNEKLLEKTSYNIFEDGTAELAIAEDGEYTLKVQSKDLAGNLSDISYISFYIKNPTKTSLPPLHVPIAIFAFIGALGAAVYIRKNKQA